MSAESRQSLGPYARVWSRPVLTAYGPFLSRIASFLPSLPTIWCQFRPSAPSEQQLLRCISFNYSCWNKHSNFHRFLGGKLLRQHRLVWWDWFPRAIRRIYCPLPSRALTFNQIEDYFLQERRRRAKSGNVFSPVIILGHIRFGWGWRDGTKDCKSCIYIEKVQWQENATAIEDG